MLLKRFLPMLIGAVSCVAVTAQDDGRPPILKYQGATQFHVMQCQGAYSFYLTDRQTALIKGGPVVRANRNDYLGCVKNSEPEGLELYKAAAQTLESDAAKSALKAYHVAYVTALKGSYGDVGEEESAYKARFKNLEDAMNKAWVEFELEQ